LQESRIEALIYFARHRWRHGLETQAANWNADALARIKIIMQQAKASKADKTGDNIDSGPIEIGMGYCNWIG
jgi:hypothetical protein